MSATKDKQTAPAAHAEERAAGMALMVRALAHRNYRLFFSGQSISLIGTWMTRIATSWLVYRLTGSALLLGVRGLALTGRINIWHVILLSVFQGIINAFDMPGRQAFVVEMVERRADLPNAIALNSSMVNAARLLGPSIGGVIIAAVGEGWCFTLDGISYIAVIASLLAMRVTPRMTEQIKEKNMLTQLREGWRYAAGFAPIRALLLLLAIVSLVGMPYTVLMPVFANDILHGGPNTLGILMAASGVGALAGALLLAARRSVLGLGKYIPLTAAAFGAGLIAFSYSRVLWLSLLLMVVTGLGFMVQMAASNTVLQTIVDEDKRGRV